MELVFQASRSVTLEVSNTHQAVRATAVLYLEKCRSNLRTYLGDRWSLQAWNQTGFTKGNLKVPKTDTDAVKEMLHAMQKYLQDHPAHQNATAGVTATAAGTLLTSLKADIKAQDDAKTEQRKKRDAREGTSNTLSPDLRAGGERRRPERAESHRGSHGADGRGGVRRASGIDHSFTASQLSPFSPASPWAD